LNASTLRTDVASAAAPPRRIATVSTASRYTTASPVLVAMVSRAATNPVASVTARTTSAAAAAV
jgi:hypothetical protein